jgi:hypothetical protein
VSQPTRTTLEPGFVARVAAGFRYALSARAPDDWFGPQEPIAPAMEGKEAEAAGVAGRQFDYRVGFNVDLRPRSGEAIGFPTLRALADNYDLLRLLIETRKDQVCGLPWAIQPRKEGEKTNPRCEKAEEKLRLPDGEHAWEEWLRMLLEDLFVLDAPTVYLRRTVGGELHTLEPIDGATIKRVIDVTGRTPLEGPAYQQILKGVPAVDYTREELIYKPRNPRTHKVYGYGPVEQMINTVNIALRRQAFTLDYFTSGTVPDALAGVPSEWTLQQIREFQEYWDLLMTDDQASRRKLKFVPGEIAKAFKEVKAPPLKDMFDEWLARVACYCFSIEPTPFVAQVNRAVAETAREQSLTEGLAPIQGWVKGLVDVILAKGMGWPDLEFTWSEGQIVDAKTRAEVSKIYVDCKVLHPDEVRADLGRDPLTPEQKEDLRPAPPPMIPGQAPGAPGAAPGDAAAGGDQGKPGEPGKPEEPAEGKPGEKVPPKAKPDDKQEPKPEP